MTDSTAPPAARPVRLVVNGVPTTLELEPRVSLLDALREDLHLTGTKKGCNQGACGACTVLVDGRRIVSCLALAVQYDGREVTTIEGVGPHPLQDAFVHFDGLQCGYCTPGQICSAIGMLAEHERGAPSVVTDDVAGLATVDPQRDPRADEREPLPLRRLQRHRRRDRVGRRRRQTAGVSA